MQNIIDEISENKIKAKKITKKQQKVRKNYEKALISDEKAKKSNLSILELSNKFGISKKNVEEYLKEIDEEKKKISEEKAKPKKVSKFKKTIENIKIKTKEKSKKIFDKDDRETMKEILIKLAIFGIPINFTLLVIFGIKFNLYSWIGWGYAFWFIKKEVISILRSLWFK